MSMQGPDDYNMMDHYRSALRWRNTISWVIVLIVVGGFTFTAYAVALAFGVIS